MIKCYKYRIYPNRSQRSSLQKALGICCDIYNYFLSERIELWKDGKQKTSLKNQKNKLPEMKQNDSSISFVNAQVLQEVCDRVDIAFKIFFSKNRKGIKGGYPRIKSRNRYKSIAFPTYGNGCKVIGDRIRLFNIGSMKIVLHRRFPSSARKCVISVSATGKWYASFFFDVDPLILEKEDACVGCDMGIESFCTLSTGEAIIKKKFLLDAMPEIAKRNKAIVVANKSGDGCLAKSKIKIIRRIYEKIRWRKRDFFFKTANKIVRKYGIICVEDLDVQSMIKQKSFTKNLRDVSWSEFIQILSCKAEEAGRQFILVNPAYTSQDCSRCGDRKKKSLYERTHNCSVCGLYMSRDHNAAINILRRGLSSLGVPLKVSGDPEKQSHNILLHVSRHNQLTTFLRFGNMDLG